MDSEHPIEGLREAWRDQRADLPSERLEACDAPTQAAVEALRAAWNQTPAATPTVHAVSEIRDVLIDSGVLTRRRKLRPWLLALEAVAALWIAYALGSRWITPQPPEWHVSQSNHASGPADPADVTPTSDTPSNVAPSNVTPSNVAPSNAGVANGPPTEPKVAVPEDPPSATHLADVSPVSLRPDGFEMRSGRVRLVLLDTTTHPPTTP